MGLSVSNSYLSASHIFGGCFANLNPFFPQNNKESNTVAVTFPAPAAGLSAEIYTLAQFGFTANDVVWLGVLGPS